jgi:hypothetical protein
MLTLEYSGKGRRPHIAIPSFPPVNVNSLAGDERFPWNKVVLRTGSKGIVYAENKCVPVTELRDGKPGKSVYLCIYVRKLEDGSIKYALCNESEHAAIEDIRKPALMR